MSSNVTQLNKVSNELRIAAGSLPQQGGAADMMRAWADRVQDIEDQLEQKERLLDLASAMGHSLEAQLAECEAHNTDTRDCE